MIVNTNNLVVDFDIKNISNNNNDTNSTENKIEISSIWNYIKNNFSFLNKVFLELDHYENSNHIGFNGCVILEINKGAGTFINKANAIFAATNGIVIKARKIKNRGHVLTQGKFKHLSGHRSELDNKTGMIFAQNGFKAINLHKSVHQEKKIKERILQNKRGMIFASNGKLILNFDRIDNTQGLLKSDSLTLQTHHLDNDHGRLIVIQNGEINIEDIFGNSKGLVDCGGILTGKNGTWLNSDGHLRGGGGIELTSDKFEMLKQGYLCSAKGLIKISTEHDLQMYGHMDAATGICLLSKKGTVWATEGTLIVPLNKIEISSPMKQLNLGASVIQAGHLILESFEQIYLSQASMDIERDIFIKSESAWITAQNTHLVAHHLVLSGKNGMINLENSHFEVEDSVMIQSKFGSFESIQMIAKGDFVFEGQRFKMSNSSLEAKNGNAELCGITSIRLDENSIRASGRINELSEGWVMNSRQDNHSNEILRQGKNVLISRCQDRASTILNHATDNLLQSVYRAASENIQFSAGGEGCFINNNWDAKTIHIQSHDSCGIDQVQAYFATMRIHSEQSVDVKELLTQGKSLTIKTQNESVVVSHSEIHNENTRIKSRKKLGFIKNKTEGSVALTSKSQLDVRGNSFLDGDVTLKSIDGDAKVEGNRLFNQGALSISTPQGNINFSDNRAAVNNLNIEGEDVHVENSEVIAQSHGDVKAKKTRLQNFKLKAKNISVMGNEINGFNDSHLTAEDFLSLFSDGIGLLQDSKIQGSRIDTTGNLQIKNSLVEAEHQIIMQKGDFDLESSHLQVKSGPLSQSGRRMSTFNSSLQATSISETATEMISIQTDTVAHDSIHRRAINISHLAGTDRANEISEHADHVLLLNKHSTVADENIQKTANQVLLNQSIEKASTISILTTFLRGTQNKVFAKEWNVHAKQVQLPQTFAVSEKATVKTDEEIFIPHSTLHGDISLINRSQTLNLISTIVNGRIHAHSSGAVLAISAQFHSPSIHIESDGPFWGADLKVDVNRGVLIDGLNIFAPRANLQSNGLATLKSKEFTYIPQSKLKVFCNPLIIQGNHLNLDHSEIQAHSLYEIAHEQLSAKGSKTTVYDTIEQFVKAGGMDLEGAYTKAGNRMIRNAKSWINHQDAISAGKSHLIESDSFNMGHSQIEIGNGTSQITTRYLDMDEESNIRGEGSLHIHQVKDYQGKGKINLGGNYTVQGNGDMTLHHLLKSTSADFSTDSRIHNYAPIRLLKHGEFSGTQLVNKSKINSSGTLAINQRHYIDPQNVEARDHLLLRSSGPITLQAPPLIVGGLTLISEKFIKTVVPLTVSKDLAVEGSEIEFLKPLYVKGKGSLYTPGAIHFNQTDAFFGNGLNADAQAFISTVSRIDIVGRSQIHCVYFEHRSNANLDQMWNSHSFLPYNHKPSNFNIQGDLHLSVKERALNDASHFIIKGSLFLIGKDLENRNHTQLESMRVKTIRMPKKFLGIRCGKTDLYATHENLSVLGTAKIEVRDAFKVNLTGTFKNEGVVTSGKMQGVINNLYNGLFTDRGCLSESSATGMITAKEGIELKVSSLLKNRGFINGGKNVIIQAHVLQNEKRLTLGSTEVVKIGTWGRHSKINVEVDHLNPVGEIRGEKLFIKCEQGYNKGGLLESSESMLVVGGEFHQTPLENRSIVYLNPGDPSPFRKKNAFSVKFNLVSSFINSGGQIQLDFREHFSNIASEINAWDHLLIRAGKILQQTLFRTHLSTSTNSFMKSENLHTIVMRDGVFRSMTGGVHLISTRGDVSLAGKVISYLGNVDIESAGDILFLAQTASVENKIQTSQWDVLSYSTQMTTFNSTKTSLPFLLAGKDVHLIAKQNMIAEEIQVEVQGDMTAKAKEIHTRQHVVEKYQESEGVSLDAKFFGSEAIKSAVKSQPTEKTIEALLKEDPSINSLFKLASSKKGLDSVINTITSVATLWNEAAKFSRASNVGNLKNTLGQHLGITDSEGDFNPRITFRLGASNDESTRTQLFASHFCVKGNLFFHADKQRHSLSMDIGKNAEFIGKDLQWHAKVEKISRESSGSGMTLTVGGGVLSVGMDHSESNMTVNLNHNVNVRVGKHLNIVSDQVVLRGAVLEGDTVRVDANHCIIESLADTYHESHQSGSLTTSGEVNFSQNHSHHKLVNRTSGVNARSQGLLTANHLELTGGTVKNVDRDAKKIDFKDVYEEQYHESLSINLNAKEINQAFKNSPSSGMTILGGIKYEREEEQGVTRALNGIHEKTLKENMHLGTPFVAFNQKHLQDDIVEMQQVIKTHRETSSFKESFKSNSPFSDKEDQIQKTIFRKNPLPTEPKSKKETLEELLNSQNAVFKTLSKRTSFQELGPQIQLMHMSNMRTIVLASNIAALPIIGITSAIEFTGHMICNSHPSIQHQCNRINAVVKKAKENLNDLLPISWKENASILKNDVKNYSDFSLLFTINNDPVVEKKHSSSNPTIAHLKYVESSFLNSKSQETLINIFTAVALPNLPSFNDDHPKISRSAFKEFERQMTLRIMTQSRFLTFGLDIFTLLPKAKDLIGEYIVKKMCQSSPGIQSQCDKVSDVAERINTDYDNLTSSLYHEWIADIAEKEVLYNINELGIPREVTEQFQKDRLKIIGIALLNSKK